METQFSNDAGIQPLGRRILIQPDKIEETTDGGIVLPSQEMDKHQQAVTSGTVVAVGEDANVHGAEDVYRVEDGVMKLVEQRVDHLKTAPPEPGNRVLYARHGGLEIKRNGVPYRMVNDQDILGYVDDDVKFGGFDNAREPVGAKR